MFEASIGRRQGSSLEMIELGNEVGNDDGGLAWPGESVVMLAVGKSGKRGASLDHILSRTRCGSCIDSSGRLPIANPQRVLVR